METGVSDGAGQEFTDRTAFVCLCGIDVLLNWRCVDKWQVVPWEGGLCLGVPGDNCPGGCSCAGSATAPDTSMAKPCSKAPGLGTAAKF